MNIRKIQEVFSVAQTSKSAVPRVSPPAGRNFANPTWKLAIRQVWKPALQTLTESKLVKPGQTKMKKYILRVRSRDSRVGVPSIQLRSQFDPASIRPNPTHGEIVFYAKGKSKRESLDERISLTPNNA